MSWWFAMSSHTRFCPFSIILIFPDEIPVYIGYSYYCCSFKFPIILFYIFSDHFFLFFWSFFATFLIFAHWQCPWRGPGRQFAVAASGRRKRPCPGRQLDAWPREELRLSAGSSTTILLAGGPPHPPQPIPNPKPRHTAPYIRTMHSAAPKDQAVGRVECCWRVYCVCVGGSTPFPCFYLPNARAQTLVRRSALPSAARSPMEAWRGLSKPIWCGEAAGQLLAARWPGQGLPRVDSNDNQPHGPRALDGIPRRRPVAQGWENHAGNHAGYQNFDCVITNCRIEGESRQ